MKTGNHIVDQNLDRAAAKWRGWLFLQRTGTIGASVCLGFLLLAAAMLGGWLAEPFAAKTLIAFIGVIGGILWLGAGILVLEKDPNRRWLSGAVERGQPNLLDRVNTLVALEGARAQPEVAPFYRRIAQQAQEVLFEQPPKIPISSQRAKLHALIFLLVLAATVFTYNVFSPWQRMLEAKAAKLAAAKSKKAPVPPVEETLELAAPTNTVEKKLAWGEVRITDPARDLQVTKVDVVPLQIEAAANEPLQKVAWSSALNGKAEQPHELPAPADPKYAVYQPTLYLDELKLSDWDLLSYYAKADTRDTNSFASQIYFLEVRPFREDILKMPGGEGGKAMQCINELSGLISQQQHVIRQTHQHAQSQGQSDKLREQDRKKLADAETDLSKATEHLYARMANEMENTSIGEALNHLAKAEKSLDAAGKSIRENALPEGQKQERSALSDLVATRKAFQKAVSDNPGAFEDKSQEETPPVAGSQDKLKEMAEFRDEAKAAQDFMEKLLQQQQAVSQTPGLTNSASGVRNLANRAAATKENEIERSLREFRQQHPRVFKPVLPEADATQQSLASARETLNKPNANASKQVSEATEKTQKLAEAMKEKSAERQLADAYKLKQELDRQIQKLGQCQNPGAGGGPSAAEMKQTAADSRQTLKQLKNVATQAPTSDDFGPALRESLNEVNMMAMNWPLGELEQGTTSEARQKAAGEAKEGMEKVSKAFEQSQPQASQMAKKSGQAGQQGEFDRGMTQLGSLIKQMESKRPVSRQDLAKLGQEALYNLQHAMPEKGGSNERGNQILLQLEKELKKGEQPVDVEILKSVMDALQAFSVELVAKKDAKEDKPEMTGLDPSRLPPAYRGRIEKYFQKLSEK